MTTTVLPLSFSKIQLFEQCELRFDYQHVTKSHKDEGGVASHFGNRVHKSFEDYCKEVAPLSPDLERFTPILDKVKGMEGFRRYELKMAVTIDLKPCAWDAPDCWLRGIADVAVIDEEVAFALDWKTGKPKDDTQQLMLMAAFLFAHFPKLRRVNTKYVWLFHPHAPSPTITYTRDMLPDLWAHFAKKVDRVEAAFVQGVFNAKPSGLCPYCPAYNTCPSARRKRW